MKRLKYKQKGNFTVEFSVVGIVLVGIFLFSAELVLRLSIQGKLDRLSYSLVNIIKERTQLYREDNVISDKEAFELYAIATNSLGRTNSNFDMEKFGVVVEALTFQGSAVSNVPQIYQFGSINCALEQPLGYLQYLSVMTSWERKAPIYRVTLCYKVDSYLGGFSYAPINSSSVIIGR